MPTQSISFSNRPTGRLKCCLACRDNRKNILSVASCTCIPWPEGADSIKTTCVLQACMFARVCACALRHRGWFVCFFEINFHVALANLFNLLAPQNEALSIQYLFSENQGFLSTWYENLRLWLRYLQLMIIITRPFES